MSADDEIDTTNRYAVAIRGIGGERVVILALRAEMSKFEALNLAAWLVAVADDDDDFTRVLQAVRNT